MIPKMLFLGFTSVFLVAGALAQQKCNGYSELCSRSYGNVTFIGAHDSAFVDDKEMLAANQHFNVTQQLDDGIRLLQSQGHKLKGAASDVIELCHTTCDILDAGPLSSYLSEVKDWIFNNPGEVVTILFTNPDGIDISIWDQNFKNSGLASLAFVPSFTTTPADTLTWPTLGTILTAGKRVVIFMDSGADQTKVPYILPEFTYMWETSFNVIGPAFNCTVDRPKSLQGQVPTGRLAVINHFLDQEITRGVLVPATKKLNVTNAENGAGSLGEQADTCSAMYGRYPNFMLVDYYDVYNGSVFKVAAKLNGVPYIPSKTVLNSETSAGSSKPVAGVPSDADAKKVLPVFIIMQIVLSGTILSGAFWLVHGDDYSKYDRIEDRSQRYSNLIPAKSMRHRKFDSVASIGSDSGFAMELERGKDIEEPSYRDSTADLTAHAALMGTNTPRASLESVHMDDEGDEASARKMLDTPLLPTGGSYMEHRRNSLFMSG